MVGMVEGRDPTRRLFVLVVEECIRLSQLGEAIVCGYRQGMTGPLLDVDHAAVEIRLSNGLVLFGVLNSIYQFQTGPPIYWSADIPLQPGMSIKDIKSNPPNTSVAGSGNPSIVNAPSVFVTGNSSSCTVGSGQSCDGSAFFNGQYVNHYRTLPQTIAPVRSIGSTTWTHLL